MKRFNKFLFVGIIISLLIPVFALCEQKPKDRDLLMGLLEETGARYLEGDINIGGTIIDRFIGEKEIEEIGNEIRICLDIKGDLMVDEEIFGMELEGGYYWKNIIKEDGFIQLMVQGFDDQDNFITFTLSSYDDVDAGDGETSLFINIIKKSQFVEINDIIEKIESFFNQYDEAISVTTCIVGTFDGYVNSDENEKTILKAIKLAKGTVVEKYKQDDVLSFSIYTPYIEECIYTGKRKMNLNIALRYNEYENKTYIWIGTPIITIGY